MSEDKTIEAEEIIFLNQILKGTNYQPCTKISYGSFGEIFKIKDKQKQYALKIISKQKMIKQKKLHEAVIQSFILGYLKHPGIVKYFTTIQTQQYICQVLEYCPYGDLFNFYKRMNKTIEFSIKRKQINLFYIAQVLQGIFYIHSKGLIHRDIKLENVVIAEDLSARIIDFGTSKPIDMQKFYSKSQIQFIDKLRAEIIQQQEERKRTQSFVGSVNYLSPQSISLQYTQASDIWSFGILIYKMFHNRLPFQGQSSYEIMKKIKQGKIHLNESLQPDVNDLIQKCLNYEPLKRPTAKQLKDHPYFKSINWQTLFKGSPPITKEVFTSTLAQTQKQQSSKKLLKFEVKIQKKMFFGNFKPRILKVQEKDEGLFMSYWYVDGKVPKNQFELMINDYAMVSTKNQFDVCNKDIKYTFRTLKNENPKEIVQQINLIIRKFYELQ